MVVAFNKDRSSSSFCLPVAYGDPYVGVKDPKTGKWGFVNLKGKTVIKSRYRSVGAFAHGLAPVVNDEGKWGYIDEKGKTVIDFVYDYAGAFQYNGLAQVDQDGLCRLIDTTGAQATDVVLT